MLALCLAAILARPDTGISIDIAAVGDVMLGRSVERSIRAHGAAWAFAGIGTNLSHANVGFGNLECVLSSKPFTTNHRFHLAADPTRDPRLGVALRQAGFSVMSVANNHALDCGLPGLMDTLDVLRQSGIKATGYSDAPTFIEQKGFRIAFLAYSDFPGPAGILYASPERMRRDVIAAKRRADLVVVSVHWGIELSPNPSPRQKTLAKVLAQAGADLVLGQHPHVLQPIVWIKRPSGGNCLVAYSLGNFIFDSNEPLQTKTEVLHAILSAHGAVGYRLDAFRIEHGRPIPAAGNLQR